MMGGSGNLELLAAYVLVAGVTGIFMAMLANVAGGEEAPSCDTGSLLTLMGVLALIPPVLAGGDGAL